MSGTGGSTGGAPPATGGSTTGGTGGTTGGTGGTTGGTGGHGGSSGGTGANGGSGGMGKGGSSGMGTGGSIASGGAGAGGTSTGGSGGMGTGGSGAGAGGTMGMAGGGGTAGGGSTHWVGSWTASPYYDSGNQPPSSMSNAVLRQVVHMSLGGSQLRVLFSNLGGNGSVTINSAHIAICKATPAVDSTIDTSTDKALAFSGMANVTIAQNKEVWSDPIDFTVAPLGNITITTAFGTVPSQVVGHSGSRTTSYLQTGSTTVTAPDMSSATKFQHWYYISGIDVMAPASAVGAVAIGDSITDGRGTDDDHNNRWTDVLSSRLQGNPPTVNVAMMNQGIGATNLIGSSGNAAQGRFDRDVLGQSGVKYAIVLDGVNDIGGGASYDSLKSAYDDLIKRARAKNVLIYGGTITPFGGNSYYSTAHEMVRQQVNTYIKSGAFDGFIDFDAAVTDGGSPPKLQATYAAWSQMDGLHPGPAGYQAMGMAADLTLFTK
jgi:lysophospholipase L1-like esterase